MDSNIQWVAANDNGEIWAIKNDDELYVRTGVTPSTPLGHSWKYVFSYINKVTTTNGYGLWAIDSRDNSAYHRGVEALEWTGFNDEAVKMAGHWFKVQDDQGSNRHSFVYGVEEEVWSVNTAGEMQYREGVTQQNHRGVAWLRTDNKNWLESVGNYDRTQVIAIDDENFIFYREGIERD
jgi:hypothetical protein